jgi:hypothetical protein
MIAYVDDYKIAGPPDNVREAWELIQELNPRAEERSLILDAPSPAGEFLGCNHVRNEIDGLRMSVDRKAGVTSLAPNSTMVVGGNHVSVGAANNAGGHIAAKADWNHIPVPAEGPMFPPQVCFDIDKSSMICPIFSGLVSAYTKNSLIRTMYHTFC